MFSFFALLFIFCHSDVDINWNVKQCSYSNGKLLKQCDDLKGCECVDPDPGLNNNETCTQCVDACASISTKDECQRNIHCEFNSQCERIDLWKQTVRFYHIEINEEHWDFINQPNQFSNE